MNIQCRLTQSEVQLASHQSVMHETIRESFGAFVKVMDHSGFPGGAEEYCSSNESGWTMYIASPSREYDDDDDYDDDDHHRRRHHHRHQDTAVRVRSVMNCDEGNDQNGDSDDSMASDASSGPVYQQDCESLERIHGKEKQRRCGAEKETVKKQDKGEEIELKSKRNSRVGREEENADRAAAKSSYGQNRSFLRKKQGNH